MTTLLVTTTSGEVEVPVHRVSAEALEALLAKHPPPRDEHGRPVTPEPYDPDAFPAALMAVAAPMLDAVTWAEVLDRASVGDQQTILAAALEQAWPERSIEAARVRLRFDHGLAERMSLAAEFRLTLSAVLRWPERDLVLALAWRREQTTRCPGCGTAAWEWDESKGGSRHAYVADAEACDGCGRLASLRDQFEEQDHRGGVRAILVRPDHG